MHPTRGNVGGNLSGNLDSVSGGAKTTRSRSQNSRKSDSHAEHYWVKVAGFFQAASFSQHRNLTWPSSRRRISAGPKSIKRPCIRIPDKQLIAVPSTGGHTTSDT